jgi:hypothetical protein
VLPDPSQFFSNEGSQSTRISANEWAKGTSISREESYVFSSFCSSRGSATPSRSSMASQMTGRTKFYTILIGDFDLIIADRLEKMPGAYPLKLWVKDRIGSAPPLEIHQDLCTHLRARLWHQRRAGATHQPSATRSRTRRACQPALSIVVCRLLVGCP